MLCDRVGTLCNDCSDPVKLASFLCKHEHSFPWSASPCASEH